MAERGQQIIAFLTSSGWGKATRTPLAGDASARRYDRLRLGSGTAVLMDAPPGQGEEVDAFIHVARHLLNLNLSAPQILAEDKANGFLLLEDLGDDLFTRLIDRDGALERSLYEVAVDVLLHLQSEPSPPDLPNLSPSDWAEAAAFAPDWYGFALRGQRVDTAAFRTVLQDLISTHADGPRVMILRDYHAENLLWLPDRTGPRRVGLLDFQLAQMGQPGYDLVSLCQDVRREVSPEVENAMIRRFVDATGADSAKFQIAYAVLGAQRALRIIGVFARLCLFSGKPGYVAMIPRVWDQLQRNLAHPALAGLSKICTEHLPHPTPERLERIRAQCGQHAL